MSRLPPQMFESDLHEAQSARLPYTRETLEWMKDQTDYMTLRCVICGAPPTALLLFKRPLASIKLGDRMCPVYEYPNVCDDEKCEEAIYTDPQWTWAGSPNRDVRTDAGQEKS